MNERQSAPVTVSIVSHAQGGMVEALLQDLAACPELGRVILTLNVPEPELRLPVGLAGRIVVLRNETPKGFGANHNAAFQYCDTPYYCVLNPDVRLSGNPFPALLAPLSHGVALTAPVVLGPDGEIEDSARRFPNFRNLFAKLIGRNASPYRAAAGEACFGPDWLAGMFMVFSTDSYGALRGFDERYFLYYEDVDICARLWRSGRSLQLCRQTSVVHAAQRASRRNLRHLGWHLFSMARYFVKYWGRLPKTGAGP